MKIVKRYKNQELTKKNPKKSKRGLGQKNKNGLGMYGYILENEADTMEKHG